MDASCLPDERLAAVVRLLELQQRAMAGDAQARAELAALIEGR